jgi:hypothetical protein
MRIKLTALPAGVAAPAVARDAHHSNHSHSLNARQLAFHDGMRKLR